MGGSGGCAAHAAEGTRTGSRRIRPWSSIGVCCCLGLAATTGCQQQGHAFVLPAGSTGAQQSRWRAGGAASRGASSTALRVAQVNRRTERVVTVDGCRAGTCTHKISYTNSPAPQPPTTTRCVPVRQVPVAMDWGGPTTAWPDLPFAVNGTAVDGDIRAGWARLSQMGVGKAAGSAATTKVIIQKGKGAAGAGAGAGMGTSAERAVRQIVRQGRLGKAVDLLVALSEEEEGQQGSVDRALVNFVLFNCMKRRDWMRALTVLDAPTIEVDIVGFTMAIKACGQARRWKEALEVLEEMEARGVSPDLVSYNCAMDALGKAGKYDRALELFAEIERKGTCVRASSQRMGRGYDGGFGVGFPPHLNQISRTHPKTTPIRQQASRPTW